MAEKNNESVKGKITMERSNLVSIIEFATKEINGVVNIGQSNKPWYKKIFKKKNDGILIKFEKDGALIVDIYIDISPMVNVPDIAYRVQENVRNSLSTMVAIKPLKINIHIENVVVGEAEQNA